MAVSWRVALIAFVALQLGVLMLFGLARGMHVGVVQWSLVSNSSSSISSSQQEQSRDSGENVQAAATSLHHNDDRLEHAADRRRRVAVCYLTATPPAEVIEWSTEIAQSCVLDVFVLADDNNYKSTVPHLLPLSERADTLRDAAKTCLTGERRPGLTLLQYNDNEVIAANYTGMNAYVNEWKKNVTKKPVAVAAWEKVVYAFARDPRLALYDFVWILEQDVFVPSVDALLRQEHKAAVARADFVAPPVQRHEANVFWQNWGDLERAHYPAPWYKSMVCMVGMSRRYFGLVDDVAQRWHKLFFLESMFNIIAETAEDLIVLRPVELMTIVYHSIPEAYQLSDILAYPNFFFHPMKALDKHNEYRARVHEAVHGPPLTD